MFYDRLSDLVRLVVLGVLTYAFLVAVLRVTGKRTLAKLNAFDFIVTVAFGSTLATVILSRSISLSEGAGALALLAALQLVVAFLSVHSRGFAKVVRSQPSALVVHGRIQHDVLDRERVTVDELRSAIRQSRVVDLADVGAVILETDGTFTVLPEPLADDAWAVDGVTGWPAGSSDDR